MSDNDGLMNEEAVPDEALLRRATELQLKAEQTAEAATERADLEAGAAEAGIDPRYLRQAAEELEKERRQARQQRERLRQNSLRAGAVVMVLLAGALLMGRGTLRAHYAVVEARGMQLDNVLQRRRDLVPRLTAAAQDLAAADRRHAALLEATAQRAEGSSGAARAQADEVLRAEMQGLLNRLARGRGSAELYARLSDEIAGAENRIAVERKRYNEAVAAYNLAASGLAARIARPLFGYPARVGEPR